MYILSPWPAMSWSYKVLCDCVFLGVLLGWGRSKFCCFGGIGGRRSTDSQWIIADPRATTPPILPPEGNSFVIQKSAVRGKIWVFDEALLQRREAKYHYHDSVDISTTNAPIEDRTKGGDSLRRNLTHKKTYLVSIFQI